MALGHLGLNVPDLKVARAYHDQVMPALGYVPFVVEDDQFAYLPADSRRGAIVFFYPSAAPSADGRHTTGLQHVAGVLLDHVGEDPAQGERIPAWST